MIKQWLTIKETAELTLRGTLREFSGHLLIPIQPWENIWNKETLVEHSQKIIEKYDVKAKLIALACVPPLVGRIFQAFKVLRTSLY